MGLGEDAGRVHGFDVSLVNGMRAVQFRHPSVGVPTAAA